MKTILALGGRGLNFANYVQTLQNGCAVTVITATSQITEMMDDLKNKKICVVVGLGGTRGTALAEAAAKVLSQNGIDFRVYATLPFSFEGKKRVKSAQETLEQMTRNGYTVVTEDNNAMLKNDLGEINSIQEAFVNLDKALYEGMLG
jgi:cell division protein FtsZ